MLFIEMSPGNLLIDFRHQQIERPNTTVSKTSAMLEPLD